MSSQKQLLPAERMELIQVELQTTGVVRVAELSRRLGVSEVTIRNDLARLEEEGFAERTHGGAVLTKASRLERPFAEQEVHHAEEKRRIGAVAASMIQDGETVILDVGTTTTQVARQFAQRKDVVVVTNGLNIALELEKHALASVLVIGGTLRPMQHSLVNPYATLLLGQIHADKLFLGCNGISAEAGVTNANVPEAEIKQAMIKAAREVVVLADSSKVGQVAAAHIAQAGEVHQLITDAAASQDQLELLRKVGVKITAV